MNPEFSHLPESIAHKPIMVLSDFDMTLAHHYVFSDIWQTHVPIIDKELKDILKQGNMGICIATARGAMEPVSWMIGHTLLPDSMPLVVENGAALLWNRPSISAKPHIEVLITEQEAHTITTLQHQLNSMMADIPGVPKDHTVRIRSHRIASIELRAEHLKTHVGTAEDYPLVQSFLFERFPEISDVCTISATGSSLTIEPTSVSKRIGILAALNRVNIDVNSIFPIGLGDNRNDTPIFLLARELGGIAIGVSKDVEHSVCDLIFDEAEHITKRIVQHIQSTLL